MFSWWEVVLFVYEGPVKHSVTNRLVLSRVYFKMLHCTWMVNDTRLFRSNCFPTDRVISNWNRCSHIHWPIYLLHWNMNQAKDGQESTFYMTTPPLISVKLLSLFLAFWKGESFKPSTLFTWPESLWLLFISKILILTKTFYCFYHAL